jgi:hypothetical protein
MRRKRPAPAGFDRSLDLGSRSRKYRLDRAITPIAHPAQQAAPIGLIFDKGTIADALHAAAHKDMPDHAIAHGPPPVSMTRAPVQREADHRSTDWMYGSGNFHPRAAAAIIST